MRRLMFLFALVVFLAPAILLAASKPQSQTFTLYDTARVGSVQLKPGDYRVEWTQTGDSVPVTIVKDGKTVAQVKAKVVDKKSPYESAAVDMTNRTDGSHAISAIQFSKVAVMFNRTGS